MSLEQQQEDQSIQMNDMFMDWFNGEEIQGDFFKAVYVLKDKIPQVIDLNTLQEAFHWQPKPKVKKYYYSDGTEIDDLPF